MVDPRIIELNEKLKSTEKSIARIENRLETAITPVNLILTRLQVPDCYKIPEEE